jgi:hypothetical protein
MHPVRSACVVEFAAGGGDLLAHVIEHEHADARRQIGAGTHAVDLPYQCRQLYLFLAGDLAQAVPKFCFERHAGFCPFRMIERLMLIGFIAA